jgi:hypothetical protein
MGIACEVGSGVVQIPEDVLSCAEHEKHTYKKTRSDED